MNKPSPYIVFAVLVVAFLTPLAHAEGNVWRNQPHGSYVPQGYSPQTGMAAEARAGMGHPQAPVYAQAYPPEVPMQQAVPQPNVQPAFPVYPEHPAWPGGYPGLMPAMPPAMTTGLPWPMR